MKFIYNWLNDRLNPVHTINYSNFEGDGRVHSWRTYASPWEAVSKPVRLRLKHWLYFKPVSFWYDRWRLWNALRFAGVISVLSRTSLGQRVEKVFRWRVLNNLLPRKPAFFGLPRKVSIQQFNARFDITEDRTQ